MPALADIDALILGCTHYSLIKELIEDFYHKSNTVDIIDGLKIIAEEARVFLEEVGLLKLSGHSERTYYISDYTDSFVESTKLFFGEEIFLRYRSLRV